MSKVGRILGNGGYFGKTKPPRLSSERVVVHGPESFVFKNGEPMRVLRPEDAAVKLATAGLRSGAVPGSLSLEDQLDAEAFDLSLSEQPHQLVGFAGKDGSILDRFGRVVGTLQPGDSFVSGEQFPLPAFMTTGAFHKEQWGDHTVLVLPRPDLKADSNTGIVTKSADRSLLGAIVMRPGSTGEVDCHIPSLNQIITGEPNKDYRGAQ